MNRFLLIGIVLIGFSCSSNLESPTVIQKFSHPSSNEQVISFAKEAAERSRSISYQVFGNTIEGSELILVSTKTVRNENPLRVLVFAQQHGNEQSGKEALLLLIRDLANGTHNSWLKNMEILVVPQLNPFGSKNNTRLNGMGIDLNRDHVIMQAPETRALHKIFHEFMPHVTIDIHEYQPYQKTWREFGAYKNFDVQVGVPTNINVDSKLIEFGLKNALPQIQSHLNEFGYSFQNYIVGPSPNLGRTRHSTVDIDDGRHSFAILNTLAFIYEGINGRDSFKDNLERRTISQYEAVKALLGFLNHNFSEVVSMVNNARNQLINAQPNDSIAIRMEHFPDGNPLKVNIISSKTGLDTLVEIINYHPVVRPTLKVKRPRGYLVPANDSLLENFLNLHRIVYEPYNPNDEDLIQYSLIKRIDISVDEDLENRLPVVEKVFVKHNNLTASYLFVPISQLHSNFLVTVFEPQSMLGLAHREGFEYLLVPNQVFPILRIE
jgi:hypothetical protein